MTDIWYAADRDRPSSELRLLMFPFAGGSATVFRNWSRWVSPSIEVRPVHLPGRDRRLSRDPLRSIDAIVAGAADAWEREIDPPYALFGHSMGASLAYELARELRDRGAPPPEALIVSAQRAPHLPDDRTPIHTLPDASFIEAVCQLGGTPDEVFEHAELVELLTPMLRADFEAVETYRWREGPPLDCPIIAYAGTRDEVIELDAVQAWSTHTTTLADTSTFDGGHFFLLEHSEEVARRVSQHLLSTPMKQRR